MPAGQGGVIKRITESLNPRVCRVVALPHTNGGKKPQWYFSALMFAHIPAGGGNRPV